MGFDRIAPQAVAMGSFMNPDTTRIIAKRIVLSGHPIKVHKKTATVRYMFFNPGESLPDTTMMKYAALLRCRAVTHANTSNPESIPDNELDPPPEEFEDISLSLDSRDPDDLVDDDECPDTETDSDREVEGDGAIIAGWEDDSEDER